MAPKTFVFIALAAGGLMGCAEGIEGTTRYHGANSYIAIAQDAGRDSNSNANDNAAVAYTPDGCQVWYIDDGLEARSSNRLDPVSGLPVCNDAAPPGTVLGPYQSGTEGIADRVPRGPAKVVGQRTYEVRTTEGYGQRVHSPSQPHN